MTIFAGFISKEALPLNTTLEALHCHEIAIGKGGVLPNSIVRRNGGARVWVTNTTTILITDRHLPEQLNDPFPEIDDIRTTTGFGYATKLTPSAKPQELTGAIWLSQTEETNRLLLMSGFIGNEPPYKCLTDQEEQLSPRHSLREFLGSVKTLRQKENTEGGKTLCREILKKPNPIKIIQSMLTLQYSLNMVYLSTNMSGETVVCLARSQNHHARRKYPGSPLWYGENNHLFAFASSKNAVQSIDDSLVPISLGVRQSVIKNFTF